MKVEVAGQAGNFCRGFDYFDNQTVTLGVVIVYLEDLQFDETQ